VSPNFRHRHTDTHTYRAAAAKRTTELWFLDTNAKWILGSWPSKKTGSIFQHRSNGDTSKTAGPFFVLPTVAECALSFCVAVLAFPHYSTIWDSYLHTFGAMTF
jgi:hypothetical protein